MSYKVKFHADFVPEWKEMQMGLKELVGEVLDHLEDDGPFLGRPEVDTLSGSRHANMKEIRVKFGRQVWRFAFAFDPDQAAIVLCGGEKQGMSQTLFYKKLIAKADLRFDAWLKEHGYGH
ncbi:type II toxin-antitoxin system RelE/ParE family toxin [Rhizobium lemnae]|uniref:Type II toxin-antitoxin system RelE/ParE family toxin n=1 Tax=Rhizobium lemnae TaxID=1214924 RepID=A0ABV8E2H0_9HYPH|nr:type II toxin-antitoxin system RelE/ParE family toxin [Rhizobium lemnae]